jgi:hypothetical protein
MKWLWSFSSLFALAASGMSQEAIPAPKNVPANPQSLLDNADDCVFPSTCCQGAQGGFLNGTHEFDRFIGFMSNPLQNIDPRALTEIWPMFMSNWVSTIPALPGGDIQLYGAGLYVALSDRLSFGLNQGGYATADFNHSDTGTFLDHLAHLHDKHDFAGDHSGWLNLGGFFQYTLIANAEAQFLLTAGLRWEAPSGSSAVFQGHGPAKLAPYFTLGKEFGEFHILATVGYEFPAESDRVSTNFFNTNVHFDRRCFGWLYPLLEFNAIYHTTTVPVELPQRIGFIDMGTFTSTGTLVAMAVGANAVLIPSKLEFGGAYTTSLSAEHGFDFNGLIVKMVFRF